MVICDECVENDQWPTVILSPHIARLNPQMAGTCRAMISPPFLYMYFLNVNSQDMVQHSWKGHIIDIEITSDNY